METSQQYEQQTEPVQTVTKQNVQVKLHGVRGKERAMLLAASGALPNPGRLSPITDLYPRAYGA